MVDTVILRFRDLPTAPGDTIRLHREIIGRLGYTWWGWWRRSYEKIPHQLFLGMANRSPAEIFLFDTGDRAAGLKLYRATLEDIAVTPTSIDISSPDVSATPRYYNTTRYSAWFKLSHIDEKPVGDLTVELLDLPTWPDGSSTDISSELGKRFSSQGDLRRLDVTLWHVAVVEL